jgi:hypothetical protein
MSLESVSIFDVGCGKQATNVKYYSLQNLLGELIFVGYAYVKSILQTTVQTASQHPLARCFQH